MRFETSTPIDDSRPMEVSVNPGNGTPFAVIGFDNRHYLVRHGIADCDRLIDAAHDVRHRLENALDGTPHPFEADRHLQCRTCGMLADAEVHAAGASS